MLAALIIIALYILACLALLAFFRACPRAEDDTLDLDPRTIINDGVHHGE